MKTALVVISIALAMAAVAATSQASASHAAKSKEKGWRAPPPYERDCTPINGRYGYYGNPWCDTGSSRPPDIEFRERHRLRYR